jgi:hypothetical protein
VPTEQLGGKLVEIAGSYKDALARAAPNPNDPPDIAKVKDAVRAALEAGQFDGADQLLAQLEILEDAALASRQLERASTSAQRGQLAMSQLRYRDAVRHFAEAARHVPADRTDVRLSYLDQEAGALGRQAMSGVTTAPCGRQSSGIVPCSAYVPAIGCCSTGRGRRRTSAPRSGLWVRARAGRRVWRRR